MVEMMKVSDLRQRQSGDYYHMTMGEYADLPLGFFDGFEKICYYDSDSMQQLLEDIRENGMTHPVILGRGRFMNGHHRFWCAVQLGLEEIPVIHYEDITERREHYTGDDW